MSQFIIGVSSKDKAPSRAKSFCARAESARIMDKPFADFFRESGRDWVNAPCVLRFEASCYEELFAALETEELPLVYSEDSSEQEKAFTSEADRVSDVDLSSWFDTFNSLKINDSSDNISCHADAISGSLQGASGRAEAARIICELTGYSAEDLRPGIDLHRDLGIDSLKMAQIAQAILKGAPVLETVKDSEDRFVPLDAPGTCADVSSDFIEKVSFSLNCKPELVHLRKKTYGFEAVSVLEPFKACYFDKDKNFIRKGRSVSEFTEPVRAWCGNNNSFISLAGALIDKFIGKVTLKTYIKPGQMLFISNHQTAVEGFLFPFLSTAISGLPLEGISLIDHGVEWADDSIAFLYSHEYMPPGLKAPEHCVMYGDTVSLLGLVPEIERSLRLKGRAFHIDVEGRRETYAGYKLNELSSIWIDLALQLNIPIVPVRFYGALPQSGTDVCDFPEGFGQENVVFGEPVSPGFLKGLTLYERRDYLLDILNGFPEIIDEKTTLPDPVFAEAIGNFYEKFGCGQIPALIYACLERFSRDEFMAADLPEACQAYIQAGKNRGKIGNLPDNADSRWVKKLAEMTFMSSF